MKIKLNHNWSSSHSYDFLDHPEDDRPIFVGRGQLLDPLVADIANHRKTGAYLISGYRGSGKTTLLIEALWRSQRQLKNIKPEESYVQNRKQFIVVLNVSEISASLQPEDQADSSGITIDPRRLLIALLRSLQNRIRSYESKDHSFSDALKSRIKDTYDKAMAAAYSRTSSSRNDQERRTVSDTTFELRAKAPYNIAAAVAGLAAVGFQSLNWQPLQAGLVHVLTAAAAVTCVWSLTRSWKLTKSLAEARSDETLLKFDNSLQQLENDLKDILEQLYVEKMRTIVVLEELDKIDDQGGAQLDSVIRYFKNLFTQAPALFIFVADKSYYDLVESRIRVARVERTYALEHSIKTEILVFFGIFYRFFNMLLWPDPWPHI